MATSTPEQAEVDAIEERYTVEMRVENQRHKDALAEIEEIRRTALWAIGYTVDEYEHFGRVALRHCWLGNNDGSYIRGVGKPIEDGKFWMKVALSDAPPDVIERLGREPYYNLVVPIGDVLFSVPWKEA